MSVLSGHHRLEGRSCVHLVLPFLVRIDKVSLYVGSGLQYLLACSNPMTINAVAYASAVAQSLATTVDDRMECCTG